ncbi:hypothetical protein FPZ12_024025 [Amycolatopsis acidicola]|uniref:Endonuclease/exonuclease/phosphatase family protein n=1 Tax=Amycolatopsis acidicola TaxID=2596893 RepID=A0A5N0UYK9_9PSEU|nr:hypothetical protein [Amycolatopsis acidicola]KAA9157954.1 hypothetical protein FPZ12_024025 [Amycolatopsis acidicola]
MSTIRVTLLNFREGGRLPGGGYDMGPCVDVVAADPGSCDLVVICEGNHYAFQGATGKHQLANALAAATGRPLVAELGSLARGEFGPVVIYDPRFVRIDSFYGYGFPLPAQDKRNWLEACHAKTGHKFGLLPLHWHHLSSPRMFAAEEVTFTGELPYPVFLAGDTNTPADGGKTTRPDGTPRPRTDYSRLSPAKRHHKGRWKPGKHPRDIVDDTAPLDYLLGWWDEHTQTRVNHRNLFDLAEIAAYRYGEHDALTPTVHPRADGSAPRIDLVISNLAGRDCLLPGSFRVEPFRHPASVMDHAAVRFAVDLEKGHYTS